MKSLKDQLLKAGLTDKQSLKNARKQKKQPQKPKAQRGQKSDSAKLAEKALQEKAAKDRQLNQQKQLEAEEKALHAQIKQLTLGSKLEREEAETAYRFTDDGKIKTIYVTSDQQKQLANGRVAIIRLEPDSYELVPFVVAEKIAQRKADYVVGQIEPSDEVDDDDPYADYQIPDDLEW